jgi:hypothetical protein
VSEGGKILPLKIPLGPGMHMNPDGTITLDGETGLPMYVIYDHPRDFPDHFVVRPHLVLDQGRGSLASKNGFLFDDLAAAREFVPKQMVKIFRHPKDDPVIVETYI